MTNKKYDEIINRVTGILKSIIEDTTVPRNIRRATTEAMDVLLSNEGTHGVRASTAISILDEISNDPNMPLYTRTKIWSVMGQLEVIKD